jgi:ATP-dependent helicase HrpB
MQLLPIDAFLPQIIETMRTHPAAVLIAPPGAGKTTRVPPALIRAGVLPIDAPNLIMLQPRRVAARASAQRIAEENGWQLGQEVGYHIRFEKRYAPSTRIRVLTEAILTRILLDDPYLDGIGCVILDEFHERNLHTDLAMAFLREIQQTVRPDLKLLVMSATLDAQPIAAFLNDAPILTSEGRSFPVEIAYRSGRDRRLEDHLANVVREALTADAAEGGGDILVFLPGVGEIERARRALAALERDHMVLLPLHGALTSEEQQRALAPDPARRQKIILATNIAETSLTIDGVRTVIDSGLARVASFDADGGMDRLDLERISQASATQRTGRAGRQAPGRAYRLWPEIDHKHLPLFNTPEIQRVDLAATALAIHAWGATSLDAFGWFERPAQERTDAAESLLHLLSALHEGAITPIGRHMLKLPIHPRIARLLIAAAGTPLLKDAINLAALLSDDDRSAPAAAESRDPLALIDRLPAHLLRVRDQLAALAQGMPRSPDHPQATGLGELLLFAFPDRVARRRPTDPYAAVMVGGTGLRLSPDALTPAIAATPLFLALDIHHDPRSKRAEAAVRRAIPLDERWLERLFPEQLHTHAALHYDEAKQKVVAMTTRSFNDLVLAEDPHGQVNPDKAGAILAAALASQARHLFEQNDTANRLLARVALVRKAMPEAPWPSFDDAQLATLLVDACAGKRSLNDVLHSHALSDALRSALPYPRDRQLDQLAPETIAVPSGSAIKIDYAAATPILAVRLQELFGLLDTPRIAAGRVPLLLHLLSPGYKPIQITQDLRSFWSAAYFEVRKDLRTRYPKHKWPDDPLTAVPEAKGRPRK